MSATVKAYFALKLVGDDPTAPHMTRGREAILAHGGAARCNVFTRFMLALFGQVPWRAVPVMPVEIMLLPRWFPFHLDKVSYWARALIVPLLILMARKPRARNPRGIGIAELFLTPPEQERAYITSPTGATWGRFFLTVDRLLRLTEPLFPGRPRERAIRQAVAFITERLNGEDGLGAIFTPMAATVMVFETLGYPKEHPDLVIGKQAVRKLLADKGDYAYVQPCLSPVWDTVLASHALMEAGATGATPNVRRALDWIAERQILDTVGDWARPHLGAAGRSSTATTTTPTLTTRRRSCARCTGPTASATSTRSSAGSNGSLACNAATAAGGRSMPTTSMTTSTTSRSPITAPCSIPRPPI